MLMPKHIMIVEDERITRQCLQDMLECYAVETIECYDNAEDAYTALKSSQCEMILMDININGTTDGIQLARKILQHKTLPIIFMSAHNEEDTIEEALDLSPYGFITKPFFVNVLAQTLKVAYTKFLSPENKYRQEEDLVRIDTHYTYSRSLKKLYKGDQEVKLNSKHIKLIDILCRNIDHTVDYATLRAEIWDNDDKAESILRTLVYSLRKQLPDLPLVSYSKVGYAMKRA